MRLNVTVSTTSFRDGIFFERVSFFPAIAAKSRIANRETKRLSVVVSSWFFSANTFAVVQVGGKSRMTTIYC